MTEASQDLDTFWLAYQNEGRKLSLRFEGFGFDGDISKLYDLPRYNEFCELMKGLAMKVFKLEKIEG